MQQITCASRFNDNDDLELVFSLDDEQGPHTLFMVSTFDSSSNFDTTSSTDDERFMNYLTIQNFHSIQPSKIPLAPI